MTLTMVLQFGCVALGSCWSPNAISFFQVAAKHGEQTREGAVAMEIPWVSMIGSVAGISTTGAFLPQVIRTWRTRSTQDISLGMFLLTVFGLLLWLIYGLAQGDWPLIVTDAVSLILAVTILGLKLRYG